MKEISKDHLEILCEAWNKSCSRDFCVTLTEKKSLFKSMMESYTAACKELSDEYTIRPYTVGETISESVGMTIDEFSERANIQWEYQKEEIDSSTHHMAKPRHVIDIVETLCKCSPPVRGLIVDRIKKDVVSDKIPSLTVKYVLDLGIIPREALKSNPEYLINRGMQASGYEEGQKPLTEDELFERSGTFFVHLDVFMKWATNMGMETDFDFSKW